MAVKKFIKRMKTKEILIRLNEAYSGKESVNETTLREKSKGYFSKKILKQEFFGRHIKK